MNQPSTSRFDPRAETGRKRKPLSALLSRYKVVPSGCWEWTGTRNNQGYGVVCLYIDRKPVGVVAPRLRWNDCQGAIPEGMVIMHTCDNPPCVNPDHLRLGTYGDNNSDAFAKGRKQSDGNAAFWERYRRNEVPYLGKYHRERFPPPSQRKPREMPSRRSTR